LLWPPNFYYTATSSGSKNSQPTAQLEPENEEFYTAAAEGSQELYAVNPVNGFCADQGAGGLKK
jgi:hypothetical protein